jgi:hypothetical protein
MSKAQRFSVYLSAEEIQIVDLLATEEGVNRTTMFRHWLLYHGMCQGPLSVTKKLLAKPDHEKELLIKQVLECVVKKQPILPHKFKKWTAETQGNCDPAALDNAAEILLRKLLEE